MSSGPDFNKLMEMAKQMQDKMQQAHEDLSSKEIVGESGGGLVKITMTARHVAKKVEIDDSVFDEDKEVLEDLIVAAINKVTDKVEQISKNMMVNISDQFKEEE